MVKWRIGTSYVLFEPQGDGVSDVVVEWRIGTSYVLFEPQGDGVSDVVVEWRIGTSYVLFEPQGDGSKHIIYKSMDLNSTWQALFSHFHLKPYPNHC